MQLVTAGLNSESSPCLFILNTAFWSQVPSYQLDFIFVVNNELLSKLQSFFGSLGLHLKIEKGH